MAKSIIEMISEGDLEGALNVFKQDDKYRTDQQYQQQVIMQSAQLNNVLNSERMGTQTSENIRITKARLTSALIYIANKYKVEIQDGDGVENEPPKRKELNILFLASNPRKTGRLQLHEECYEIEQALNKSKHKFETSSTFEPRADNLQSTLLEERPNYIHFAGHGTEAVDGFSPAGIILQDIDNNSKVIPGNALADIFKLAKERFSLKMVFLNACSTMEQARGISSAGIYSIGMADEIPDILAINFAKGFYGAIADKPDDIKSAFNWAINNLNLQSIEGSSLPKLFKDGEEVTF